MEAKEAQKYAWPIRKIFCEEINQLRWDHSTGCWTLTVGDEALKVGFIWLQGHVTNRLANDCLEIDDQTGSTKIVGIAENPSGTTVEIRNFFFRLLLLSTFLLSNLVEMQICHQKSKTGKFFFAYFEFLQ